MKIALISGQWPSSDLNGLQNLGNEIVKLGHSVDYFHHDDSIPVHTYPALIGHSFGGDRAIQYIRENDQLSVRYLGLIDPVVRGWFPMFWLPWGQFKIPKNVMRADCFQRRFNLLPPSSPIRNSNMNLINYSIDASHGDAPRNWLVRSQIIAALKANY